MNLMTFFNIASNFHLPTWYLLSKGLNILVFFLLSIKSVIALFEMSSCISVTFLHWQPEGINLKINRGCLLNMVYSWMLLHQVIWEKNVFTSCAGKVSNIYILYFLASHRENNISFYTTFNHYSLLLYVLVVLSF